MEHKHQGSSSIMDWTPWNTLLCEVGTQAVVSSNSLWGSVFVGPRQGVSAAADTAAAYAVAGAAVSAGDATTVSMSHQAETCNFMRAALASACFVAAVPGIMPWHWC